MGIFKGDYNYMDVIKFKKRGMGIVTGYIIGVRVDCAGSDNERIVYSTHSTPDITPSFHFYDVPEDKIIKE
jgi:hypothetical protein